MKLFEKLTDEEVGDMETDVDDTQCSEQIVDSSSDQRIVDVDTALHRSESQNESLYKSSTRQDTHTKWWRRSSKIRNLLQQVAKIVSRHDPAVNQ